MDHDEEEKEPVKKRGFKQRPPVEDKSAKPEVVLTAKQMNRKMNRNEGIVEEIDEAKTVVKDNP